MYWVPHNKRNKAFTKLSRIIHYIYQINEDADITHLMIKMKSPPWEQKQAGDVAARIFRMEFVWGRWTTPRHLHSLIFLLCTPHTNTTYTYNQNILNFNKPTNILTGKKQEPFHYQNSKYKFVPLRVCLYKLLENCVLNLKCA